MFLSFLLCFSPMLSGTTSSRFCVSSRSVRARRPFSSEGSSSRRFSDTSRHTSLRRFPSSYTHTKQIPLTVSRKGAIQPSQQKQGKIILLVRFIKISKENTKFLQQAALKITCINLYLLVVMRTTGYGQATAPSGWGEHRACPAKRWDEAERRRGGSILGPLLIGKGRLFFCSCLKAKPRNACWATQNCEQKSAPSENGQRGRDRKSVV